MSTVVLYCWCHSDSASVLLYFTYNISYLCCLCIDFKTLVWLLVCCLYKEVYFKKLNVCPFDCTAVAGSGKVGPENRLIIPVGWL